MTPTRSTRALLALALPLLLTATVLGATPASAGPGEVTLPSAQQVREIYPHISPRGTEEQAGRTIDGPGRTCRSERTYRGETGTTAWYGSLRKITAARPFLSAQAVRFASTAQARKVVAGFARFARGCRRVTEDGTTFRVRPTGIGRLGQQRVGLSLRSDDFAMRMHVVRRGRLVTLTDAVTLSSDLPAHRKAVAFTRLTLRTTR